MRKVFYLSGGMTNLSIEESNGWREQLENYFSESYHIDLFNPNNHWKIGDLNIDEKEAMEYDLHRLRHSDLVIVNFNDKSSLGTAAELAIAYELRIPIIGLHLDGGNSDLHPWQCYMCQKIFSSIDELYDYIMKHYAFDD